TLEPVQTRTPSHATTVPPNPMPTTRRIAAMDVAISGIFPDVLLHQISDFFPDEVDDLLKAPGMLTHELQLKFLNRYRAAPGHLSLQTAGILYFTLSQQPLLNRNHDLYTMLVEKFCSM